MSSVIDTAVTTLTNAPLPLLIEKLGLAIAEAQLALDQNSIKLANQMAQTEVTMPNGKSYNLLAVGFKPTFYSFTEASIEASMEFSLAESESFGIGGSLSYGNGSTDASANASISSSEGGGTQFSGESQKESKMFGASISGYYASKFESSAKGSSSIMARMISLPAPDRYLEVLEQLAGEGEELALTVQPIADISFAIADPEENKKVSVLVSGGTKPYSYTLVSSTVTIADNSIDLSDLTAGIYPIEVKVTDTVGSEITVTFSVTVT